MKKILFLIQWYPSEFSANALCDQKIISELHQLKNHKIDVLAYRSNGSPSYEKTNGIGVYRFRRSIWWNTVIDAKKQSSARSLFILAIDKIFLRIRMILTIPIYPIVNIHANQKFKREARKLYLKNHYDLIISEHHGSDSLYAGTSLKKEFSNVKHISILWDPISAKLPPRYLPENYTRKRLHAEEIKILKLADKVVAMKPSEQTVSSIMHDNPLFEKYVFYDIPGIIKPSASFVSSSNKFLKKDKINIIFSGILSLPDRDPEYIIKSLNLTNRASDINLIFLCTGAGKNKLQKLQELFKGNITISSYIGHNELAALYKKADVLLNFGGSNPNMVPSKIFEYMSYGKPIISTYDINNESSKTYFAKYRLAVCIDQKKKWQESAKKLEAFFNSSLGKEVDFNDVAKIFTNNTPKIYVNLINRLLRKDL